MAFPCLDGEILLAHDARREYRIKFPEKASYLVGKRIEQPSQLSRKSRSSSVVGHAITFSKPRKKTCAHRIGANFRVKRPLMILY